MLETFETVAKAVADPSRIRILKLLGQGELCVCQITAVLDLAPATISKHLAVLKTAGLLLQRRDAKWVHYRIADRALNPYALNFIALIDASLTGDPTIEEDLRVLNLVNAVPVQVLCDQGRSALGPDLLASEASNCCGVPQ